MSNKNISAINLKPYICFVFIILSFVSNGYSQLLLRTNTSFDFSAVIFNSDSRNLSYLEKINAEESVFYRKRFNKQSKEKTVYNIFSVYYKNTTIGFCPFGIDADLMSEHFNRNKANTFRYWNKIRMGLKFLFEKNINDPNEMILNYIIPELYFSYLHVPHLARGDLTTKARKGSLFIFVMTTPTKRSLTYFKFNVGSAWIMPYFKQESIVYNNMENSAGLNIEFEINRNGYNHSKVESSKDIYRGITIKGGPEYNLSAGEIIFNLGISVTTENH